MALQLSKHFSPFILFVCSWCVCHLPVLLKVSASVSEFCCLWGCAIKTQLWQMAPLLHTNTYTRVFVIRPWREAPAPIEPAIVPVTWDGEVGLSDVGPTCAGSWRWPSAPSCLSKQTCCASHTVLCMCNGKFNYSLECIISSKCHCAMHSRSWILGQERFMRRANRCARIEWELLGSHHCI